MEDINFFKTKEFKEKISLQKYLFLFIIIIVINLTFSIYLNFKVNEINNYKNELVSKLKSIRNNNDMDRKLKNYEDSIFLENESKRINDENIIKLDAKTKIELILNLLPNDVYISNLEISKPEINISGKSNNKINIYEFYKNLRLLDYSNKTSLNRVLEKENNYYFDINIEIR